MKEESGEMRLHTLPLEQIEVELILTLATIILFRCRWSKSAISVIND